MSLIASWPIPAARWRLLVALGVLVLIDVITLTFHYPRLAIMFQGPMPEDAARLRRAAREWAMGILYVPFCWSRHFCRRFRL